MRGAAMASKRCWSAAALAALLCLAVVGGTPLPQGEPDGAIEEADPPPQPVEEARPEDADDAEGTTTALEEAGTEDTSPPDDDLDSEVEKRAIEGEERELGEDEIENVGLKRRKRADKYSRDVKKNGYKTQRARRFLDAGGIGESNTVGDVARPSSGDPIAQRFTQRKRVRRNSVQNEAAEVKMAKLVVSKQPVHARHSRDLTKDELAVDVSSSARKNTRSERDSNNEKRGSGRATGRKTEQGSSGRQTKEEKQSNDGQGRKTGKRPGRNERPPKAAKNNKSDSEGGSPSASKGSSRAERPGNRPTGGQKDKAPARQGRARRPRDSSTDEKIEKEEEGTGTSTGCLTTGNADTESGSTNAERSADEPEVKVIQSVNERAAEPEAIVAEPPPPEEEVEETPEPSETAPATEPSVQDAKSDDPSDRKRRHVLLEEGKHNLDENPETLETLRRTKRQQMGFLHYRKPNPAAFTGKPYTGRPWPVVSRRPNQGRP